MLLGSVTVALKSPAPDSLSIGICSGRPRVVPNRVADEASALPQNTWKVTELPGVALAGSAVALAPPESATAACTGVPAPRPADATKCLMRRMNVPPPNTVRPPLGAPARGSGVQVQLSRSPVLRWAKYPAGCQANAASPGVGGSAACC